MSKIKQNWYFIPISLVFIIAIALRLKIYLFALPLGNDECALALNIVNANILSCFKPLAYGQAAPPLFLVISAFLSKIISSTEFSLRLFPLVASILSIFVFYDFSKKVLNKKSAVFFALILFCFNFQPIYYTQVFKQYSSDVLLFLGILTSYFYLNIKESNIKKLVAFGLGYGVCIWFSFTSLFAIFTLLSVLLLKQIKEYKKIILLFVPIVISFSLFYISQRHLSSAQYLHDYWVDGFITKDFSNLGSIFINYFVFAFNNLLLFILFFVGLILKLSKIKDEKSLILFIPLCLAVILSYLAIYPLDSRVALYLIPIFILFMAQIIDYINLKNKAINYILYSLLILICCTAIVLTSTYRVFFKEFDYEDVLSPLNTAKESMKDGDILYISDGSIISYDFYKPKFNFKNVILEKQRISSKNDYEEFLNKLPKGKTYYYIFSHFPDKKQRLSDVFLWANTKKNFKIYVDKSLNALIIFTQ